MLVAWTTLQFFREIQENLERNNWCVYIRLSITCSLPSFSPPLPLFSWSARKMGELFPHPKIPTDELDEQTQSSSGLCIIKLCPRSWTEVNNPIRSPSVGVKLLRPTQPNQCPPRPKPERAGLTMALPKNVIRSIQSMFGSCKIEWKLLINSHVFFPYHFYTKQQQK